VTGGAGFIGNHLTAALLQRGHQVTVLDNLSTGLRENVPAEARFVLADVADYDAIAPAFDPPPDVVMHVAGQASNIKSFHDPGSDVRVNLTGTINVVRRASDVGVPRLLYASSMMVYGRAERIPTPEDEPCLPTSYYGISKYAAERFVHATALRPDLRAPLHVTSFRMFNVYGEGQSVTNPYQGVLAIFVGNVVRGEPITIHSDGRQSRDFVYVDDVVRAWVAAMNDSSTYGQVFNLGEGVPRSVNELADGVIMASGGDPSSYPIARQPERPGDLRVVSADISRAREVLGWKPQVPFDEGLRRVLAWARRMRQPAGRGAPIA
jgi:UDP-glucose 4-epimerase